MLSLLFKKPKHGPQPNKLGGKTADKTEFTSQDYLAFAEIAANIYNESQKYEAAKAQAAAERANNERQKLLLDIVATRQLQERQSALNQDIARRQTKEFRTAASMKQMRQQTTNAAFNRSAAQLDYRHNNEQQLAAIMARTDFFTKTTEEFGDGIGLFRKKMELDNIEREKQNKKDVATNTGGGVIKTNEVVEAP